MRALGIIAVGVLAILVLRDCGREPKTVEAVKAQFTPEHLYSPCPLTPRNLPRKTRRIA